ncbi:hypothetical protein AVEN_100039-1, partial [Araneus ventricosus]
MIKQRINDLHKRKRKILSHQDRLFMVPSSSASPSPFSRFGSFELLLFLKHEKRLAGKKLSSNDEAIADATAPSK